MISHFIDTKKQMPLLHVKALKGPDKIEDLFGHCETVAS